MRDDRFEWDDEKARSNLTKHKISFDDARYAFDDLDGFDQFDTSVDYGEDRFNRTAFVGALAMTVTFVDRAGRIRIISARKATKNEQSEYFEARG